MLTSQERPASARPVWALGYRQLDADFAHGTYLVPLAPITEPGLGLRPRLLRASGIREAPDRPLSKASPLTFVTSRCC